MYSDVVLFAFISVLILVGTFATEVATSTWEEIQTENVSFHPSNTNTVIILTTSSPNLSTSCLPSQQQEEEDEADCHVTGSSNNKDWAHGRKHVFLSEGARQQLERMRETRRQTSAVKIQSLWRGWHARGGYENCKQRGNSRAPPPPPALLHHPAMMSFDASTKRVVAQRPRPQPISGTPPPMVENQLMHVDRCDFKTIQQTCQLFGLDLVSIC